MAAPLGNRNAVGGHAAQDKPFSDALKRALLRPEGKGKAFALERVAQALIAKAETGDTAACKEIADRLDGKSVQAIAATVDTNLVVELVKFVENPPAG